MIGYLPSLLPFLLLSVLNSPELLRMFSIYSLQRALKKTAVYFDRIINVIKLAVEMSCLSLNILYFWEYLFLGKHPKTKKKETKLYFKNSPVSNEVQAQSSFLWNLHVNSLILPRA